MLTQLSFDNIKNHPHWEGALAGVTLFCGRNRSGKTAAMEAIRLALTNTCSVGAAVNKKSLITQGNASARVTGADIEGNWSYRAKQSFDLKANGIEAKNVTGDCPITIEGYWELTGEQRWALVESVCGAFTEQAPPNSDASKAKLKDLQSKQAPDPYNGEPIAALEAKLIVAEQRVAAMKKAQAATVTTQGIGSTLAQAEAAVAKAEADLASVQAKLNGAQHAASKMQKLVGEWEVSPEYTLTGLGSSVGEILDTVITNAGAEIAAALSLLPEGDNNETVRELEAIVDRFTFLSIPSQWRTVAVGQDKYSRAASALLESVGYGCTPTDHEDATAAMERVLGGRRHDIERATQELRHAQDSRQRVLDLKAKLDEESQAESFTIEQLHAAKMEVETLQGDIYKAATYKRWIDGAGARIAEIELLQQQVADSDKALAEYQQRRAKYLDDASALVANSANRVLSHMGMLPVKIEIGTTGKRNTLTATSGGVDIAAMSGAEKMCYGSALLNAFQELSNAFCPVLMIEAAELDDDMLERLLESLGANRTKGNVFVSHWSTAAAFHSVECAGGFVSHVFDRPEVTSGLTQVEAAVA